MNLNLLTADDLKEFKQELFNELRTLLSANQQTNLNMLKSTDVKKILRCSDSKLDVLRSTGKLPFKKVLGVHYYRAKDVEALFDY